MSLSTSVELDHLEGQLKSMLSLDDDELRERLCNSLEEFSIDQLRAYLNVIYGGRAPIHLILNHDGKWRSRSDVCRQLSQRISTYLSDIEDVESWFERMKGVIWDAMVWTGIVVGAVSASVGYLYLLVPLNPTVFGTAGGFLASGALLDYWKKSEEREVAAILQLAMLSDHTITEEQVEGLFHTAQKEQKEEQRKLKDREFMSRPLPLGDLKRLCKEGTIHKGSVFRRALMGVKSSRSRSWFKSKVNLSSIHVIDHLGRPRSNGGICDALVIYGSVKE